MSTYKQEYYEQNKERLKQASRDYYAANREKQRAVAKAWRERNPERVRANIKRWQAANSDKKSAYSIATRRRKYGFTPELFNERLQEQNNQCCICSTDLKLVPLAADHCHATNTPRGILCKRCNLLLGHAKDNPQILANAIDYLHLWKRTA